MTYFQLQENLIKIFCTEKSKNKIFLVLYLRGKSS